MQGARPIYIYRLAPCTENCSQRIYKTFSIKYLEHVHIFSTFEPKKHKSVFQAAVSTCTLKILCCGYNMATIKKDKKIKDYDTRSCSEMVIFLSLRKQGCKSASYAIYTLYYTQNFHCLKKTYRISFIVISVCIRESNNYHTYNYDLRIYQS